MKRLLRKLKRLNSIIEMLIWKQLQLPVFVKFRMTNQTQEIVYTSESLVLNIPEHVLQMIIIESVVCNRESISRKKAIFALQLTCKRFYKVV